MDLKRRSFMAGLLAAGVSPALCKAKFLMPMRKIVLPRVFDMEIGIIHGMTIISEPYRLPGSGGMGDYYLNGFFDGEDLT